jgi:hypothetical protein
MKKGLIIGCVGCGAVAAVAGVIVTIIVVAAFGLTSGAVAAADQFLALLGDGKFNEAYVSTAAAFQSEQTEEEFVDVVHRLGLGDFASASWSSRSVNNDLATLEGTVRTKAGGSNKLTVKLIKQGDSWKILSLSGPATGAVAVSTGNEVPSDEELRRLVAQSLMDFNEAILAEDFSSFHEGISELWKNQITVEQLAGVFQPFVENEIDISPIKDMSPEFNQPPAMNEDGFLVVSGYYPTQPSSVFFELNYCYEHPEWKLAGIQVNVR